MAGCWVIANITAVGSYTIYEVSRRWIWSISDVGNLEAPYLFGIYICPRFEYALRDEGEQWSIYFTLYLIFAARLHKE